MLNEQIDQAIRLYDKLLLILSPASMESTWVETEISKARKREINEGKRVLFPVGLVEFQALKTWERFDADTGIDSARETAKISFRISAIGRTTIPIRKPSSAYCAT